MIDEISLPLSWQKPSEMPSEHCISVTRLREEFLP